MENIKVNWNGRLLTLSNLTNETTVGDLRTLLHNSTNVEPEMQKILGLSNQTGTVTDQSKLSELKISKNLMMVGSTTLDLKSIGKDAAHQITGFGRALNQSPKRIREETFLMQEIHVCLRDIRRVVNNYNIEVLNAPRKAKRLVVFDLDYTLFDVHSPGENGYELARPYLHDLLSAIYPHYDIVIWSATTVKWVHAKVRILSLLTSEHFKISFVLDSLAMTSFQKIEDESIKTCKTKSLSVIWGKFPMWNQRNSVIVDDCVLNFASNPRNGIQIKPFRNAHINRSTDKELVKLKDYLLELLSCPDMSKEDHTMWDKT